MSGRSVTWASRLDGVLGVPVAVVFASMVDATWSRLKACRQCRWSFYDYSRNHSARWCSMSICGNRTKTRGLAPSGRSG